MRLDLNRHKIIVNSKQESSQEGIYATLRVAAESKIDLIATGLEWPTVNNAINYIDPEQKYNPNTQPVYKENTTNQLIRGLSIHLQSCLFFLLSLWLTPLLVRGLRKLSANCWIEVDLDAESSKQATLIRWISEHSIFDFITTNVCVCVLLILII